MRLLPSKFLLTGMLLMVLLLSIGTVSAVDLVIQPSEVKMHMLNREGGTEVFVDQLLSNPMPIGFSEVQLDVDNAGVYKMSAFVRLDIPEDVDVVNFITINLSLVDFLFTYDGERLEEPDNMLPLDLRIAVLEGSLGSDAAITEQIENLLNNNLDGLDAISRKTLVSTNQEGFVTGIHLPGFFDVTPQMRSQGIGLVIFDDKPMWSSIPSMREINLSTTTFHMFYQRPPEPVQGGITGAPDDDGFESLLGDVGSSPSPSPAPEDSTASTPITIHRQIDHRGECGNNFEIYHASYSVSGGVPPYSYRYSDTSSSFVGSGSTSRFISLNYWLDPSITDGETFTVEVTDSVGNTAADVTRINTGNQFCFHLDVDPRRGRAPLTVNFSLRIVGGDGPYNLTFDPDDGSPEQHLFVNRPNYFIVHEYASSGIFNATLLLTDRNGKERSVVTRISVGPRNYIPVQIETVQVVPRASAVGLPVFWEVNILDGQPPFQIDVSWGNRNEHFMTPERQFTLRNTYDEPGSYDLGIFAVDYIGNDIFIREPGIEIFPDTVVGDFNGDCAVDFVDFFMFVDAFNQFIDGNYQERYDVAPEGDPDGVIDTHDLVLFASNFNQACALDEAVLGTISHIVGPWESPLLADFVVSGVATTQRLAFSDPAYDHTPAEIFRGLNELGEYGTYLRYVDEEVVYQFDLMLENGDSRLEQLSDTVYRLSDLEGLTIKMMGGDYEIFQAVVFSDHPGSTNFTGSSFIFTSDDENISISGPLNQGFEQRVSYARTIRNGEIERGGDSTMKAAVWGQPHASGYLIEAIQIKQLAHSPLGDLYLSENDEISDFIPRILGLHSRWEVRYEGGTSAVFDDIVNDRRIELVSEIASEDETGGISGDPTPSAEGDGVE